MAIDPWLPWFAELEDACAASDRPRIRKVFEDLDYRFAHGALVQLYGDPKAKHWERITILWKGAPDAWSPVLLGFKRA
jgi:hypothetical protein